MCTRVPMPSKHGTLTQCWFDVGLASQTMGQHQTNFGWTSRVFLVYTLAARECRPTTRCLIVWPHEECSEKTHCRLRVRLSLRWSRVVYDIGGDGFVQVKHFTLEVDWYLNYEWKCVFYRGLVVTCIGPKYTCASHSPKCAWKFCKTLQGDDTAMRHTAMGRLVRGLNPYLPLNCSNCPKSTKFRPRMARPYTFDFSREPSWTPVVGAIFDKSKMAAIQIRVTS